MGTKTTTRARWAVVAGLAAALVTTATPPAGGATPDPRTARAARAEAARLAADRIGPRAEVGPRLDAGEQLRLGDALVSASGQHELAITSIAVPGFPSGFYLDQSFGVTSVWDSDLLLGHAGRLVVQADGNVVVYDARDRAVWSTRTTGSGVGLVLQDDGNLVVYAADGTVLWASLATPSAMTSYVFGATRLEPGHFLVSEDRRFRLVLQADGNLVHYGPTGALWSTGTSDGTEFVVQEDGNLVLYAGTRAVWHSGTATADPADVVLGHTLVLQDDANLVLHRDTFLGGDEVTPVWSSGAGRR